MKKVVIFILIVFLILASFVIVHAQQTEQEKVEKVYSWLINKTRNRWNTLDTKENVFALLALKSNSTYLEQGNTSLIRRSYSSGDMRCWSEKNFTSSQAECKLVETALAKIALDELEQNTTRIENWIMSKNKTQTNIFWYLQIDVDRDTEAICEVDYLTNEEKIFIIHPDKTVSLNGASHCFENIVRHPQYWFEVKETPECLGAEYAIKCWSENATMVTATFLYKKNPNENRWYVSTQTSTGVPARPNEAAQDLEPRLKIPSYCLGEQDSCNYEGTLWATYALAKQQKTEKANLFVPYLVVNRDDGNNRGFFPSAFLAAIIDGTFTQETINLQHRLGYWKIQRADNGTFYGTLYNTALAKLMLKEGTNFETAKTWILSTFKAEGQKGFFSDPAGGTETPKKILENAFVLWQFWPEYAPGYGAAIGQCTQLGGICKDDCSVNELDEGQLDCSYGQTCCKPLGGETENCSDYDGSCRDYCLSNETFWNQGSCLGGYICCVPFTKLYCEDIQGTFCNGTQVCSVTEVETADSYTRNCCPGTCTETGTQNRHCYEIGKECETGEACINTNRIRIGFTRTINTDKCCEGDCVLDKYCESDNIGTICETGECTGTNKKTIDTDYCCQGTCTLDCEDDLHGTICTANQECTGKFDLRGGPRCCVRGICKEKKASSLLWIIILVIVVAAVAAFYFFFVRKKPKKEKEETGFLGFKPGPPVTPTKPMFPRPVMPPRIPTQPEPSSRLQPLQPLKSVAQLKTQQRPAVKPTPKPAKPIKPKTKEKTELEKTLEKLKKMTKK
ncbi:MAG: hypothetical protein QXP53_01225 [Candidatus Pacearchaeota archaeon]